MRRGTQSEQWPRLTAGVGQQTSQGGPVHVGTRITAVVVLRGPPGPWHTNGYPRNCR